MMLKLTEINQPPWYEKKPTKTIQIKIIKPSAPNLSEPKIHNENYPFTSLINNQNAPSHKLAKILETLIINSIMLKTL